MEWKQLRVGSAMRIAYSRSAASRRLRDGWHHGRIEGFARPKRGSKEHRIRITLNSNETLFWTFHTLYTAFKAGTIVML